MKLMIDCYGHVPKRGDVVQTNVGNPLERTCLVLAVKRCRKAQRFNVWAERWWQIEPDLRMRLYRSAERSGGQRILFFVRYKLKKRHVVEGVEWPL